jgi:hypothetical protein
MAEKSVVIFAAGFRIQNLYLCRFISDIVNYYYYYYYYYYYCSTALFWTLAAFSVY